MWCLLCVCMCGRIFESNCSGLFRGKVTESNVGYSNDSRNRKMVGLYPPSQIPFRFLVHLILLKIFFLPLYCKNVRFFIFSCKIKARILLLLIFQPFCFLNAIFSVKIVCYTFLKIPLRFLYNSN